eukprot:9162592-Pyramimonas_sp.AAC.1
MYASRLRCGSGQNWCGESAYLLPSMFTLAFVGAHRAGPRTRECTEATASDPDVCEHTVWPRTGTACANMISMRVG